MANRKVALVVRILENGKQKAVPPVYASNGRLRPLWGMVNGIPQHRPEARYYLRYTDGERRVWEAAGTDPSAALAAKLRREHVLASKALGIEVVEPHSAEAAKDDPNRVTLASAIKKQLDRIHLLNGRWTQIAYDYRLPHFAEVCGKKHLDEITSDDMVRYISGLREQGLADRTVANRVVTVTAFLKRNGITGLLAPHERPRYDEKVPDAYTEEQLQALFAAADAEERMVFQFFLGSGCREQEVSHATWRDVNFSDGTFTVHSKRERGFGPKDKEERVIPLPDQLLKALRVRKAASQGSLYIFPNRQGTPEGHFLRILKSLALRAGLNCGECVNKLGQSCKDHPVCDAWTLHKFRRSFATIHHESGVSARTLQAWLGHSSLETTLAYLQVADLRSERTRTQVNRSFEGFGAWPVLTDARKSS